MVRFIHRFCFVCFEAIAQYLFPDYLQTWSRHHLLPLTTSLWHLPLCFPFQMKVCFSAGGSWQGVELPCSHPAPSLHFYTPGIRESEQESQAGSAHLQLGPPHSPAFLPLLNSHPCTIILHLVNLFALPFGVVINCSRKLMLRGTSFTPICP